MADGLASHRQQDDVRQVRKDSCGGVVIVHPVPGRGFGLGTPARRDQPGQRQVEIETRLCGVAVHGRGEGVRGVHHDLDLVGGEEVLETADTAEPAQPRRSWDGSWGLRASRQGCAQVDPVIDQSSGQLPGLCRAAKNEDVHDSIKAGCGTMILDCGGTPV